MKRERSSLVLRERAAELREQGWTVSAIAEELGYSRSAVDWWLLELGAERPGPLSRSAHSLQTRSRKGHLVRPFSAAEDEHLLAMADEGQSLTAIARSLTAAFPGRPRTHNTVKGRLMTLARREERALALATSRSAGLVAAMRAAE